MTIHAMITRNMLDSALRSYDLALSQIIEQYPIIKPALDKMEEPELAAVRMRWIIMEFAHTGYTVEQITSLIDAIIIKRKLTVADFEMTSMYEFALEL